MEEMIGTGMHGYALMQCYRQTTAMSYYLIQIQVSLMREHFSDNLLPFLVIHVFFKVGNGLSDVNKISRKHIQFPVRSPVCGVTIIEGGYFQAACWVECEISR